MSRIGKKIIEIPQGVEVMVNGASVAVKGPKGELSLAVHHDIKVTMEGNVLTCEVARNTKQSNALWGTMRALIANMVLGVTDGFEKKLELQGVGYRAALKGKNLELQVGYSHPVLVEADEGITFGVEKEIITIQGIDAKLVGQVAADIRKVRPPEPYKGKGIRYVGENVRRKVGKVVGTT